MRGTVSSPLLYHCTYSSWHLLEIEPSIAPTLPGTKLKVPDVKSVGQGHAACDSGDVNTCQSN